MLNFHCFILAANLHKQLRNYQLHSLCICSHQPVILFTVSVRWCITFLAFYHRFSVTSLLFFCTSLFFLLFAFAFLILSLALQYTLAFAFVMFALYLYPLSLQCPIQMFAFLKFLFDSLYLSFVYGYLGLKCIYFVTSGLMHSFHFFKYRYALNKIE